MAVRIRTPLPHVPPRKSNRPEDDAVIRGPVRRKQHLGSHTLVLVGGRRPTHRCRRDNRLCALTRSGQGCSWESRANVKLVRLTK